MHFYNSFSFPNALAQSILSKMKTKTIELKDQVKGYAQEIILNSGIIFKILVTYTTRTPHQNANIVAIGTKAFPQPRSTPAAQ